MYTDVSELKLVGNLPVLREIPRRLCLKHAFLAQNHFMTGVSEWMSKGVREWRSAFHQLLPLAIPSISQSRNGRALPPLWAGNVTKLSFLKANFSIFSNKYKILLKMWNHASIKYLKLTHFHKMTIIIIIRINWTDWILIS